MTAQEYITKQINRIISEFPHLYVKYQNDVSTRTHVIEVLPFSEASSNKQYLLLEEEISMEFMKLYPDYTMYFTDENTLVGIENIDYQQKGGAYKDRENVPINYGYLIKVGGVHSKLINSLSVPQPILIHPYSNNLELGGEMIGELYILEFNNINNAGENTLAMAA